MLIEFGSEDFAKGSLIESGCEFRFDFFCFFVFGKSFRGRIWDGNHDVNDHDITYISVARAREREKECGRKKCGEKKKESNVVESKPGNMLYRSRVLAV